MYGTTLLAGIPSNGTSPTTGQITYYHASSIFKTSFSAGNQTVADITYTLPLVVAPIADAVLQSTTGGVLSWSVAAGITGSGIANQVAYFSGATTIAGDAGMTYVAATDTLSVGALVLTTPLALAYGGTAAALVASTGGIFYSGAAAGAILAGTATARQMLQSGASAAPAWSTTTWPATTTVNRILYSSSASVIGEITTANSGVLVTSGAGVPSIATDIPTAVTIGTAYIYRIGGTDVSIADGGTNASSFGTTNGLVYYNGTSLVNDADLSFDGTALTVLQYARVGTATDAVAQGMFSAGLTGGNRMLYDTVNCSLQGLDSSGGARWFTFAGAANTKIELHGATGLSFLDLATTIAADFHWRLGIGLDTTTTPRFSVASSGAIGTAMTIAHADGSVILSGYLTIGTATDAATQGDLSSGLTGAARIFYDQSADLFYQYTSGNVAHKIRNGLYAYKSSDESVTNSTTLQADDALTVTVAASTKYAFRAKLFVNADGAVSGVKVGVNGTSTITAMKVQVYIYDDVLNSLVGFARLTTLGSAGVGAGLSTGVGYVIVEGSVDINGAGTFYIEWAQNTVDAVNAVTVQVASDLNLERLT